MMPRSGSRGAVAGFVLAGLLLALYPLARPWEGTTTEGTAEAFASTWWPIAHTAAVLGFLALALAWRALSPARAQLPARELRRAETGAWLAVALLGPYYGAEAYGLHAIGRRALEDSNPSLTALADQFRYAPLPVTIFGAGLLALALLGGQLLVLTWDGGSMQRLGGVVAGLGLLTYLPQFFAPPAVRVTHGLLLGVGLVLVGLGLRLRGGRPAPTAEVRGAPGGVSPAHPWISSSGVVRPRLGSQGRTSRRRRGMLLDLEGPPS